MNVLIIGSTGTIGQQLLEQCLAKEFRVTAFARNPEKLATFRTSNLRIHQGDIFNYNNVADAVQHQDVVLCALGDGNKGNVRAPGTHNLIRAMQANNVNRLICQTTLGLGSSYQNLNFFWKHIMFGFLLKKAFKDHQIQEDHILKSELNWTIIRPGAFTNGKLTGQYQFNFGAEERNIQLKISRADVAHCMINMIDEERFYKKCISLSY